jgi:hypothetical protein
MFCADFPRQSDPKANPHYGRSQQPSQKYYQTTVALAAFRIFSCEISRNYLNGNKSGNKHRDNEAMRLVMT